MDEDIETVAAYLEQGYVPPRVQQALRNLRAMLKSKAGLGLEPAYPYAPYPQAACSATWVFDFGSQPVTGCALLIEPQKGGL